jgi:hypothetical protein
MAGYTRQSTFTDGDIINAADSNDEFNQLVNSFSNTTGHKHNGDAGEGPVIGLIGDPGVTTPINKVVVDDTNNRVGFYVDVSSISTEQIRVQDGAIVPVTDNDVDLGASGAEFKDLYIDGVAYVDSVAMPTTTVTDILDEDTMTSDSATALATQQSIKAYVDAQVTAQDLDFQGDSGGALNIDLDTETLTIAGGTGIDTTGSGNTLTVDIDSTVATLTGTQTLTNKTLTSAVLNTGVSGTAVLDEDNMASDSDTQLATQQSIKAYVDAQLATQDALDEVLTTGNSTGGTDIVVTAGDKITTDTIDETTAAAGVTIDGAVLKDSGAQLDSLQLNDTGSNYIAFNAPTTVTTSTTFTLPDGDGTTGQVIQTNGSGTLTWTSVTNATGNELENVVEDTTPQLGGDLDVNGNSIVSASNGDIAITPNGTGNVVIDGLNHPQADGTAGQFLKTDGAGQLAFDTVTQATGNELENVVEDTTPQLGGDLDVNGNKITSASNGDIDIEPNGTGNVLLGNFEFDVDQTVGAGQDDYVLTYDNSTGHISLEVAAAGGISDVVSDTTPQLGGELDSNGNDIKLADDDNLIIGTDSDALLFHNSATNRTNLATDSILIKNKAGTSSVADITTSGMEFFWGNDGVLQVIQDGVLVDNFVGIENHGTIGMYENTANGTNYIGFKAPSSVTATTVFTMPDGDGTSGQSLTTDGSGTLSWATPSAAGDGDGLAYAIALG